MMRNISDDFRCSKLLVQLFILTLWPPLNFHGFSGPLWRYQSDIITLMISIRTGCTVCGVSNGWPSGEQKLVQIAFHACNRINVEKSRMSRPLRS